MLFRTKQVKTKIGVSVLNQSMKKTCHINAPYKLIGKWLQSTKMSQQIKLVRICEVETKIKTNSLIDYIPLGSGYIS